MAIAFLVFDVELLFLYPWAVAMGGGGREERGEGREERTEGRGMGTSVPIEVGSGRWAVDSGRRRADLKSDIPNSQSPIPVSGIDAAVAAGWVESRDVVFGGAMLFFVLLVLGFVYDWRKGVFRWR
jgi:hypothetical protein